MATIQTVLIFTVLGEESGLQLTDGDAFVVTYTIS